MLYYTLPEDVLPIFAFAHKHETTQPCWTLNAVPDLFEISYVQEGALRIECDGSSLTAQPGSILCLPHDREKLAVNLSGHHIHHTVAFRLSGIGTSEVFCGDRVCLQQITVPDNTSLYLADLRRLSDSLQGEPLRRGAVLLNLLSNLAEHAGNGAQPENPLCRGAKQLIRREPEGALSPTAIAETLGVSYGHLSRVFRQTEGMTLTRYITRVRLEKVRDILMSTDATLEAAGKSAGFGDVKYLSRQFRKTYSMSAREYIRTVRRK